MGPFQVLKRIERLVYRLDVPANWQIYNVFSITRLKPAPNPAADLFGWSRPDHPDSVFVKGNIYDYKSFEIEQLLNERITNA